jgi:hypothetical protein
MDKDAYTIKAQTEFTAIWIKIKNDQDILNADPIIFADDTEDAKAKIHNFHQLDDDFALKYPNLANRFQHAYSDKIQINLTPDNNFSTYQIFRSTQNFKEFVEFIKEQKSYDYSNHPSEDKSQRYIAIRFSQPYYKEKLNNQGIYVRPVKKILEYNPQLAAKQLKRSQNPKKRISKNQIPADRIWLLQNDLEYAICDKQRLVAINKTWKYDKTIKSTSTYCIVLIGIFEKILIPPRAYRKFRSFHEIRKKWPQISDKERDRYAANFKVFMDKEVKKKAARKIQNNPYKMDLKINTKFFKYYYNYEK